MISVILTAYNRGYTLKDQIEAIKNQSIKIDEIIVFYNKGSEPQIDIDDVSIKTVKLNYNSKFHGRFAFAFSLQADYIAIFDDDIIPGVDWIKSCIESDKIKPGIYGASGILLEANAYAPHIKIGWNGIKNSFITEVDLVGHSWVFKKEYLKYMWYEEPIDWNNGEDIQFSFLAKKYGNVKTYVPPHPIKNMKIWGNIIGKGVAMDKFAFSRNSDHLSVRNLIVKHYIDDGSKIIRDNK